MISTTSGGSRRTTRLSGRSTASSLLATAWLIFSGCATGPSAPAAEPSRSDDPKWTLEHDYTHEERYDRVFQYFLGHREQRTWKNRRRDRPELIQSVYRREGFREPQELAMLERQVLLGMTPNQVRIAWGSPDHHTIDRDARLVRWIYHTTLDQDHRPVPITFVDFRLHQPVKPGEEPIESAMSVRRVVEPEPEE